MPLFPRIVSSNQREKKARENMNSAIKNLKKTKSLLRKKQMEKEKDHNKRIRILKQKLAKMNNNTEKKLTDLQRRLKKLSPLHNWTKKRSSSSKTKKLSPRAMSALQKNLDLEDEFSILKGGRFRKTNKRYKRYKR
jgi:hypothetical protein